MSNKKIGNEFENEFCELMFKHGWWVHNMAQNSAGQPADVIALKGTKALLIDCKVVSTAKGFSLSRIEDNQKLSMTLFQTRTRNKSCFAIKYKKEDEIIVIDFNKLRILLGKKSYITYNDAKIYGRDFEEWIDEVSY